MQVKTVDADAEDRTDRQLDAISVPAQAVASVAALGVLIWVLLSPHALPIWPLVAAAVVLGASLVLGPVVRDAGGREIPGLSQPVASFTALLLIAFGVADPHKPASLLRVVALLLAIGLVLGPLGRQVASGRAPHELALPAAALTAILVFIWPLANDGYSWFTGTNEQFIGDDIHAGTVRLVIALFGAVIVAAVVIRPRTLRRLVMSVATVVALTALLATLASSPPAYRFYPQFPYYWGAAILSLGLAVDLLMPILDLQVLGRRIDELSRTRSGVLDVQASELRRIERDLHDGAQVRLVALTMKLGRAEDLYRDDPKAAELIREAREDATAAIRELRELARGIATPVLAKRGLEPAVRSLAQRSGLEVRVDGTLTRRLAPVVESAAYFVVAESLANAAKHARGARVEVGLHENDHDLFVDITDFGPGGADPGGSGLTGLRQRVEALDGSLRVTSPGGVGTQIEAVMPCAR